ncbi:hypothetical protein AMS68_001959 [Peltaster fructicola]|uniref:Rho-GAP domain-containing protein n=1 Tax=Peltaster fructicola TaxID=286661 RepID=A0A6H0XNV7_9PEZI|nr:hypothetical protein AMS68_001959 [Peltaster fructicola]
MPSTATTGPTPVKANIGPTKEMTAAQSESVQSKRDLASWWKQFKRSDKKPQEAAPPVEGIFGVPLQTSIRYANVAISLFNDDGTGYIYGYVPIVVAKCGVFLKEKATDVEGIFRLAGSEKRIKELKVAFDSPDRYGKGLDWTGYTVHDAANILRRYFNQLPEPIIPLDFYDRFRDPIRNHQAQAVGQLDAQSPAEGDFDTVAAIKLYQGLITELPPLNRQLLLYILDLLAVFASKADLNKMTTPNLAAIFQPGILSHPQHNMAPQEYRLSQDVLIFLIVNQDSFLIGMPGTAADQETVKDVQSGAASPGRSSGTPSSPGRKNLLGRSSSNASTGTESRWNNLRRNVSVSSRHSKQSGNGPTPLTPGTPNNNGVQRSNTVPSRRTASAAQSPRFSRDKGSDPNVHSAGASISAGNTPKPESIQSTPVPAPVSTFLPVAPIEITSASSSEATTPLAGFIGSDTSSTVTRDTQTPKRDTTPLLAPPGAETHTERSVSTTPSNTSARGFLNILKQSPQSEGESRKPNKLQKKRIPGSALSSAQSSSHDLGNEGDESARVIPAASDELLRGQSLQRNPTDATVRRAASPTHSVRSHTSVTDQSDADMVGDDMPHGQSGEKPKKRRWRFSRSQNKLEPGQSSTNPLGTMSPRDQAMSKSTIGSQPRRESQDPAPATLSSAEDRGHTTDQAVFSDSEREKKSGPVGWIRGKLQERREKESEKRAKTPERKVTPGRGPSFEVLRPPPVPQEASDVKTAAAAAEHHPTDTKITNEQTPTIVEETVSPTSAEHVKSADVATAVEPVVQPVQSVQPAA